MDIYLPQFDSKSIQVVCWLITEKKEKNKKGSCIKTPLEMDSL